MKSALLVIDMINDFLEPGAILEVPMGRKIIPSIAKRIVEFESFGWLILFVNDRHRSGDAEFKHQPVHACYPTDGMLPSEKLRKLIKIHTLHNTGYIYKQTYSGFLDTELEKELKYWNINKVYITGILTNICVFVTAVEAQMRGYETYVYKDSVAALTQEVNDRTLEQLEKTFKIKIL